MKKWQDYSKPEKAMLITIGILIVLILFSSTRISRGIREGFGHFFSVCDTTAQAAPRN